MKYVRKSSVIFFYAFSFFLRFFFFAQVSCATWAPQCSLVPISNGFMAQVRLYVACSVVTTHNAVKLSYARGGKCTYLHAIIDRGSFLCVEIKLLCVYTANVHPVSSVAAYG